MEALLEMSVSSQNVLCNRRSLISIVFGDHPDLLRFFFNHEGTDLAFKDARSTLRVAGQHFEADRYTLIRLALDIWLGTIRTKAIEIPTNLDARQIENLMIFFTLLRTINGCNCQNCRQRFERQVKSTSILRYNF